MQPPAFKMLTNTTKNNNKNIEKNNNKNNIIYKGKNPEPPGDYRPENKTSNFSTKKNLNYRWEEGLIFDPEIFLRKCEESYPKNVPHQEEHFPSDKTKYSSHSKVSSTSHTTSITTPITTPIVSSSSIKSTSITTSFSNSFSLKNLEKIILKSIEGRCIESFLRCKFYLKSIYSFSDEKCQLYSPDEKVC